MSLEDVIDVGNSLAPSPMGLLLELEYDSATCPFLNVLQASEIEHTPLTTVCVPGKAIAILLCSQRKAARNGGHRGAGSPSRLTQTDKGRLNHELWRGRSH